MEMEFYDTLFLRSKESLQRTASNKSFTPNQFSSSLRECYTCISHGLGLIKDLLKSPNAQLDRLCIYLENTITLLQTLLDLIKSIVESTTMSCCRLNPFPTITGNIIQMVFMHCKDSECIYGSHLKLVETQLKVLFRTCHELQMTYLMTLEKNFVFNLTEQEEQEILIEALNINMKIGVIVQALDVKSLAEQWKAFTLICEKYLEFLLEKNYYIEITQSFGSIIKDNIRTALELEEDNKNVLRSLRVANFTIKILSRLSNVFRNAPTNNYNHIIELLVYIYMHNPAYFELFATKSPQFANFMQTNILSACDRLCDILVLDGKFLDNIAGVDMIKLETNTLLGYIILFISLMKAMLPKRYDKAYNTKFKMINCIFKIVPVGHYWYNIGLRFQSKDFGGFIRYYGLYEYFLVHAVAFSRTINNQLYVVLERRMYQGIMSTDLYAALFSSHLWVQVLRTRDDLALDTFRSLIRIYQSLEKHPPFYNSPQEIHLRYTIRKIFQVLLPESKMLMSKMISPQNSVWYTAKVCDLPKFQRRNIEGVMLEIMKVNFHECFLSSDVTEEEINNLIQIMKMCSTCSFVENTAPMEQYLVKLWSKACRKNKCYKSNKCCPTEPLWNFKYLAALVVLTECIGCKFSNSADLGQVLHIIATKLDTRNAEMIFLLFDLFCSLTFNRKNYENQQVIDSIFKDTLKLLMHDVQATIKSYVLYTLSKYRHFGDFLEMTSTILSQDEVKNEWKLICDMSDKCINSIELKELLMQSGTNEFIHKCILQNSNKSIQSEFDLGDPMSEIVEPAAKRPKLNSEEIDDIVGSLENDALLLSSVDNLTLSDDYKKRIANIIDKLKNIVS
ncbi:FIGNL1-interacting regulator of recombination and mitosis-like [Epargyreus clarus]|uniref:FIGNL1-interacting regulator of recombination and mitosis-like n=1 Tax=Epargyreus clarus TaxID=520877 RepID=UPI003C2FE2E2